MKEKKLKKKLVLKKETVAELEDKKMQGVKGGACTCINTGCATYIWQNCGRFSDCGGCGSFFPTECDC